MKKIIAISVTATLAVAVGIWSFYFSSESDDSSLSDEVAPVIAQKEPVEVRYPFVMPSKSSLSVELSRLGMDHRDIHEVVKVAKPFRDLARILPGTRFNLVKDEISSMVSSIRFRFSPVEVLQLTKINDQWAAEKIEKPVDTRVVTYMGTVKTNLWESAREAEMNPSLIAELSEILLGRSISLGKFE